MFAITHMKQFKQALTELLAESIPGSEMYGVGLCHSLSKKTNSLLTSYEVMNKVLTDDEYGRGIGPMYTMSADRWYFGQLLLTLSDKELLEICNA